MANWRSRADVNASHCHRLTWALSPNEISTPPHTLRPMNQTDTARMLIALAVLVATPAFPQKSPAPSRDVFRCEEGGKVVYSDNPCLGAQRIHVEPSRGLDSASGRKRTGADVRRENLNAQTAEALRPVFNETAQQQTVRHRRAKLPAPSKSKCARLDARIPQLERAEKSAKGRDLTVLQQELLVARQRYRSIGC